MYKVIVDVKSNIKQLAEATKEKGRYRKILTEVASELSTAVKSNTPVNKKSYTWGAANKNKVRFKQYSGNLKKSIGIIDSKSQNYVRVWVGPKVRSWNDGWYAGIVEAGHKIYNNPLKNKENKPVRFALKRWRNKGSINKTQGYVKANPFITETYNAKKSSLEAKLVQKIGVDLETLIKQNNNA